MKDIEMYAAVNKDGLMTPQEFRIDNKVVVKVLEVFKVEKERLIGGAFSLKYFCKVNVKGEVKVYELRYNMDKMVWKLEKI